MVLAAGVGSRLRPLTDATPKALIEVGGKPMLELVLRRLQAAGVTGVVLNVFHLPETIEAFLKGRDFGLKIALSREDVLLDTGGGLKQAGWFFNDGEPFFLHNVDVYCEADLKALYAAHRQSNALATLAVSDRPSRRRLVFSQSGLLLGREPAPGVALGYDGISVLSPAILPLLDRERVFSLTQTYVRLAAEGNAIRAHRIDGAFWADIGGPEGLKAARERAELSARTPH